MDYQVIWLDLALADLDQIAEYIARDSPRHASVVIQTLMGASRELARFPHMGPVVPEWNTPQLRQRIVYSYRLIYRIHGSRIEVLGIIHGARALADDMRDRH